MIVETLFIQKKNYLVWQKDGVITLTIDFESQFNILRREKNETSKATVTKDFF